MAKSNLGQAKASIVESVRYKSPIGELLLTAEGNRLASVQGAKRGDVSAQRVTQPVLRAAMAQLDEYFMGRRQKFDLPLRQLDSSFSEQVWQELRQIPFGEVRSYKEIAENIGSPKAARAVGGACGRNPFFIVIPCHRVITQSGDLGGFALDIKIKRQLLTHEGWLRAERHTF